MWRLKTRASGHGFGSGNNCAEFCYNIHKVKVDGQELWSWQIMQECADNASVSPRGHLDLRPGGLVSRSTGGYA